MVHECSSHRHLKQPGSLCLLWPILRQRHFLQCIFSVNWIDSFHIDCSLFQIVQPLRFRKCACWCQSMMHRSLRPQQLCYPHNLCQHWSDSAECLSASASAAIQQLQTDSRDMGENGCGSFVLEAITLICQAMAQLEVGQMGVVSYGGSNSILPLRPLEKPFTDADGPGIMAQMTFAQVPHPHPIPPSSHAIQWNLPHPLFFLQQSSQHCDDNV